MSLESHVEELKRKHAALKAEIAKEQIRPGGDEQTLKDLKRRKLKLKDEIARMAAESAAA